MVREILEVYFRRIRKGEALTTIDNKDQRLILVVTSLDRECREWAPSGAANAEVESLAVVSLVKLSFLLTVLSCLAENVDGTLKRALMVLRLQKSLMLTTLDIRQKPSPSHSLCRWRSSKPSTA